MDKIIQVSGFGVKNTERTQCDFMVVGITESGKIIITQGDGIWCDISPKKNGGINEICCKNKR